MHPLLAVILFVISFAILLWGLVARRTLLTITGTWGAFAVLVAMVQMKPE